MSNPTLPTVAELRADEGLLRQTIGAVLEPGPYLHDCLWIMSPTSHHANGPCHKCGRTPDKPSDYCSIPGLYDDELEVAAERLSRKTNSVTIAQTASDMAMNNSPYDVLCWWIDATPTDRCICALLALGRAQNDGVEL